MGLELLAIPKFTGFLLFKNVHLRNFTKPVVIVKFPVLLFKIEKYCSYQVLYNDICIRNIPKGEGIYFMILLSNCDITRYELL